MHLIVLLCDVDEAEADFILFGNSVNLGTIKMHGLRLMYHRHRNRFGHTCWYSFVMYVKWKLMRSRRVRWPIFRWEMADNSIGGWRWRSRSDYNRPRTLRLSNRYTSSDGCRDLAAWQPATRAPVLEAIEEPARTRRTSTQLPNKYEGFNLKT
jgi:hypothetical protein